MNKPESEDCRTGFHYSCTRCSCPCHPRSGRKLETEPDEPVQTEMRGCHNPPPLAYP